MKTWKFSENTERYLEKEYGGGQRSSSGIGTISSERKRTNCGEQGIRM